MFSSKKDTAAASAAAAASTPLQPLKRTGRSAAPSIISADLVVNGTLTSTGDIQVDGRVEGDVRSAGLVVGDKAFIHGEVMAEGITVCGRVQGSIRARKVLLCATCHVEGNILHEAFAVETGAFFEGNCRHADNPLSDDNASKKPSDIRGSSPSSPSSAPSAASSMVSRTMAADANRPLASTFAPLKSSN